MKTIKIQMKELSKFTNTPIFAYCRKLIKDGEDFNTRLEVYRDNEEFAIAVPKIGVGAQLTVKEDPVIHVAKYREVKVSL